MMNNRIPIPITMHILVKVNAENEEYDLGNGKIFCIPKSDRAIRGEELGEVLAIGSMAFKEPVGDGTSPIKIGDKVFFKRYAGTDFSRSIPNSMFRMIYDSDVVGICKEEDTEKC